MSFIYPRLITITRPGAQSTTEVGFQGEAPSSQRGLEETIATGVPCSIQSKGGGNNPVGLPADGKQTTWRVLTPLGALADGQVQDRDIVVDDLGRRFQIQADYTNSLGANFLVQRIEA